MKRFPALMIALACALSAAAPAPVRAQDKPVPKALEKLNEDGGQITFMGHAYGLDGWLLLDKTRKKRIIAYTSPEGGIFVNGILLTPEGENYTNVQLQALREIRDGGQTALPGAEAAETASAKTEKIYAEIEKAAWVRAGREDAPYIYMFMNVGCTHCQAFWRALEDPIADGAVQVRLLPFGRQDVNRTGGAALLSVPDPAAAWTAFMEGDETALGADKVKPGTEELVDANTALFNKWRMKGPPFTMYRRPQDGRLMAVAGVPSNTLVLLADLMKKGG